MKAYYYILVGGGGGGGGEFGDRRMWDVDLNTSNNISLFQCWGFFYPKYKDAKLFENHLNPVMLVFIE